MAELRKCIYCGFEYLSNQSAVHNRYHNKKIDAEEKFGHIATYIEREFIKKYCYENNELNTDNSGIKRLMIYSYWSRSVEGSKFNINHPTFQEYFDNFETPNVKWLK